MADEDQIVFRLTADDSQLIRDLARIRNDLSRQKLALRASLDRTAIDSELATLAAKPANVRLGADTTNARGAFAEFLQSVNKQRSTVHIGADVSAARASYESFARSVGKPLNIPARVNVDRSSLDGIQAKPVNVAARVTLDQSALDRISVKPITIPAKVNLDQSALSRINVKPITIPARIAVDATQARAEYDRFARSVGRSPAAIRVTADARQARTEIADLRRMIGQLRAQAQAIRISFDGRAALASLAAINRQIAQLTAQAQQASAAMGGMRAPAAGRIGGFGGALGGGAFGGFATRLMGGGPGATFGSAAGGALGSLGGPGGIALGAAGGAGIGAAGDATVGVIGNGLARLDELEKFQATLRATVRDQEKANALFAELRELNESLPTVPMAQLAEAATKLAGSGMDSAEIPQAITSILDAAATSSDGVAVGTSRVVRAISQIRTNQKLLGEELNQLTETGIPAAQILERQFNMSIEDIKDASQRGEIAVDEIIQKLLKGFREERGGGLAEQAGTLSGKMAGLQKQFDEFSMKVAEPLLEPLIASLGRLADAADAGAFNGIADAMIRVTEASVGFLQFLNDLADRTGDQKHENNLSVSLNEAIQDGGLTPEQTRAAQAAQLASNKLADRRREDPNAMLSQQETADFFTMQSGQRADPNAITEYQQAMVTQMLDIMAAEEASKPAGGIRRTERIGKFSDLLNEMSTNVGPGGKFADRELDRQRIREIAARGFSEEDQARVRDGAMAGDSKTAAAEAANTVSRLADGIGQNDGDYDEDITKQITEITDLIISGQIDATVAELEALKAQVGKAGNTGDAKRIEDAIKAREAAAKKQADQAKAQADQERRANTAKAAGFVNRGVANAGGFFSSMADKVKDATGIDPTRLPAMADNLREGDALREKERLRTESDNRRFDKAERETPDAFKKFVAGEADPEVRAILEQSKLSLAQVSNGRGGFDPQLAIKELGEMTQKRGVQETDMAGLGRLVQGNIDEAVQREQAKKMLEAQQKIADFAAKQNEHLAAIREGVNKPRETTIAAN